MNRAKFFGILFSRVGFSQTSIILVNNGGGIVNDFIKNRKKL
jgi:hypothetical protein